MYPISPILSSVLNNQNNIVKVNNTQKTSTAKLNDTLDLSNKNSKKINLNTIIKFLGIVIPIAITAFALFDIIKSFKIPSKLKPLLKSLKGLEGEEFTQKAYSGLVNYMGLKGLVPETYEKRAIGKASASYSLADNSIVVPFDFFNNPKNEQFDALSHELMHAKQTITLMQYKDFDFNQYVFKANKNRIVLMSNYELAKHPEWNKKDKNKYLKETLEKLGEETKENFKEALALPKIKPYSIFKLIKAKKYEKATFNYKTYTEIGEKYAKNYLEKEAYEFGYNMGGYFQDFMNRNK